MIDQFHIGSYRNFVYLVVEGEEALVVDPQSDLTPWQARLEELGARLTGVLLTHSHWDHVAGVPAVVDKYGAMPIYVHQNDARRLEGSAQAIRDCFKFVEDGEKITVGRLHVEVLHTPGHSAGECCYLVRENGGAHLLTGDTVFVGDVGRTDLESGSVPEMFETIQRLKQLPPETIIYPGHDYGRTPTTTIARECESNPSFLCKSVEELHAIP